MLNVFLSNVYQHFYFIIHDNLLRAQAMSLNNRCGFYLQLCMWFCVLDHSASWLIFYWYLHYQVQYGNTKLHTHNSYTWCFATLATRKIFPLSKTNPKYHMIMGLLYFSFCQFCMYLISKWNFITQYWRKVSLLKNIGLNRFKIGGNKLYFQKINLKFSQQLPHDCTHSPD